MGKVLMRKTVFDNKTGYHRAGEIVNVSADVERHYLHHNYATKPVDESPVVEVIEPKVEAVEVETKEEKIVYKTKGNKAKKDAADQD
jgi:transposase-like protein